MERERVGLERGRESRWSWRVMERGCGLRGVEREDVVEVAAAPAQRWSLCRYSRCFTGTMRYIMNINV